MTTTTTRCNDIHDRYAIDWELCSPVDTAQWAQLDTGADAAWFGQWVNPFRRIVLAYCEGELRVTRCDDDRELAAELHRIADWHRQHDRWKGIDPWNDILARRLEDAGAGDLVHGGAEAEATTQSLRKAIDQRHNRHAHRTPGEPRDPHRARRRTCQRPG